MAVNYAAALKDTRMTAVLNAIDNNAAAAYIEIGTAAMAAVIVTITLSKPSFSEGSQQITMLGVPKSGTASLAGTNTAAAARIKDGGGNVQVSGLTVGTSGSDINLNSTSITSGQTVTLSSGTITHAP
jgi:hypothetical protein